MSQPQYLTAAEVSAHFQGRISVRTLNNWRSSGGGPPFRKIGGKVLYPASELERWEQSRTFASTSQYSTPKDAVK
jgi:hypothetical protein